jgi:hypothetical protein
MTPTTSTPSELGSASCSLCGGNGHYMYDHNHGKPCEGCCKHTDEWWELTEHHAGYIAGADNGCCRAGCGQLRREIHQANAQAMASADTQTPKTNGTS